MHGRGEIHIWSITCKAVVRNFEPHPGGEMNFTHKSFEPVTYRFVTGSKALAEARALEKAGTWRSEKDASHEWEPEIVSSEREIVQYDEIIGSRYDF